MKFPGVLLIFGQLRGVLERLGELRGVYWSFWEFWEFLRIFESLWEFWDIKGTYCKQVCLCRTTSRTVRQRMTVWILELGYMFRRLDSFDIDGIDVLRTCCPDVTISTTLPIGYLNSFLNPNAAVLGQVQKRRSLKWTAWSKRWPWFKLDGQLHWIGRFMTMFDGRLSHIPKRPFGFRLLLCFVHVQKTVQFLLLGPTTFRFRDRPLS